MFFKEVNEIDLGETTIANIFIDIFMPMANGLYVKVYLLGYRQACDPNSNPKFDNNSIAKNLNIPLSDVIDAWKFWQNKNIIRMHKNEGLDDFDYSIEFLDLKKFYMDNMHINTKSIKSNSDSIVSASENPSVRKMFTTINKIVGRYLDPGEKISILEIMIVNCRPITRQHRLAIGSNSDRFAMNFIFFVPPFRFLSTRKDHMRPGLGFIWSCSALSGSNGLVRLRTEYGPGGIR